MQLNLQWEFGGCSCIQEIKFQLLSLKWGVHNAMKGTGIGWETKNKVHKEIMADKATKKMICRKSPTNLGRLERK
jgi:hypothetical protein